MIGEIEMISRIRWIIPLLVLTMIFTAACGVMEPTPTPTLIMPNPTMAGNEQASPTPELEASPTEPEFTATVETATPAVATPTQTATASQNIPGTGSPVFQAGDDEWPLANYDYRNSRANLNAAIRADSVIRLNEAWRFTLPVSGSGRVGFSNPLVADGVVYLQDWTSSLFALDLETGVLLWEYRLDLPITSPNGPALGYGKVFIPAGGSEVHAVDIESGEALWVSTLLGARSLHQPYVYNGLVLTGSGSAPAVESEGSQSQSVPLTSDTSLIYALDQDSGEIVWQFDLAQITPDGTATASRPGVFAPPAVDEERGLGFWGIRAPASMPGLEGSTAAGLHANSILAINLASGELVWHEILGPGDLFGPEARISPVLFEVEVEGEQHSLVAGAGSFGTLTALDRETGAAFWGGGEDSADPLPAFLSGVHAPLAYANGVLYVPITSLPASLSTQGQTDSAAAIDLTQASGELMAVDAASGRILWSRTFDSALTGGATITNDLVFTITNSGGVFALDRVSGLVIWQAITAPQAHLLPAVAGDTLLLPASGAANQAVSLVALRLGVARTPLPARTPTQTPTPTAQAGEETPVIPTATPEDSFTPTATPDDLLPPPASITPTAEDELPVITPTP
jgi:outer membrane protein assembly factor BamB